MHIEPATVPTTRPILASRKDDVRARLNDLDIKAANLVAKVGCADQSLKSITADLLMAGVEMAKAIDDDYEAWTEFAQSFGIRCKGLRDREYREIGAVLLRERDGRPTTVYSQISRLGAAICVAVQMSKKVKDPQRLKLDIIEAGCIDGLSKRRREQIRLERDRNTASAPIPVPVREIVNPTPNRPLVVVLMPDSSTKLVPADGAAQVLAQMGIAQ
jgi:hypothetical protein